MKTIFAAALISAALTTLAGAQQNLEVEVRNLGNAFSALAELPRQTNDATKPLIAQDAFAGLSECGVIDAKTIRAYSLPEAYERLEPCFKAVSRRYKTSVMGRMGVIEPSKNGMSDAFGVVLTVAGSNAPGIPVVRDLNFSLAKRKGFLAGQRAVLRLGAQAEGAEKSYIQAALNECFMPTVVREIDSAADFVHYYSSCLKKNGSLRVMDVVASKDPNRKLGVILVTAGDEGMIESLNGFVTVNAGCGPVQVEVFATPTMVHFSL